MFIVVVALALGAAGYFALAFTPIEAGLTALATWSLCIVVLDRGQRKRAESRFETAIDELSRLLSTDARAGQLLSQRIDALAAADADNRLAVVEADISVLGTVIRQVAEAVSDLENALGSASAEAEAEADRLADDDAFDDDDASEPAAAQAEPGEPEPRISRRELVAAIADDRLLFHMAPIVSLPQRKTYGYDLVPRLKLEDGGIADTPDFMPRSGGADIIRDIEWRGIQEAVMSVRRARTSGAPVVVAAPISRIFVADRESAERLIELLDANRAVARSLVLRMSEAEWHVLEPHERQVMSELRDKGVSFSLSRTHSLRLDFDDLSRRGVRSVRVAADQFVDAPASLTDYHSSDIAPYIARFEIDLIAENVASEQQLLSVLEDGIKFAQGPHIAQPAPIRADLLARRDTVVTGQKAS